MKSTRGFTVIELLIVVVVLLAASVIFFIQKSNIESAGRDDARRTSINAMYYNLEEVYAKANKSTYPRTLTAENLTAMDPELLKDPSGVKIGESDSDFRYEPTDCTDSTCKGYTLRSTLEQEDDYVKTNRD